MVSHKTDYEFAFWRYSVGAERDSYTIWQEMRSNGNADLFSLNPLPIDEIARSLRQKLEPEWRFEVKDGPGGNPKYAMESQLWLRWHAEHAMIEAMTNPFYIRVNMWGDWRGEDANLVIDVLATEYGCPLYDPWIGESGTRFDEGMKH